MSLLGMLGIKTQSVESFEVIDVGKKAEDLLQYNIDLMKTMISDQKEDIARLRLKNEELEEQVRSLIRDATPLTSNISRVEPERKKLSTMQQLVDKLEEASQAKAKESKVS